MSTPLSFCDISARYGQTPAPQLSIEEQTGWNPKQLFMDYMLKVKEQRRRSAKEAEEDALMAMIDAMNASEEDKASGKTERTLTNSLTQAGKAVSEQYDGKVDPTTTLTVQVLLSCLGDRFNLEQADEIEENIRAAQELREQEAEEACLGVTEQRDLSETGNPSNPTTLERR